MDHQSNSRPDKPMRLDELTKLALEVRVAYDATNASQGRPQWGAEQYLTGLVGDVGDLAKLVSASRGYRDRGDVRSGLEHELSDCLWSILVLADQYGVDLGAAFANTMNSLLDQLASGSSEK